VLDPPGVPTVDLILPADVSDFYSLCGGARLFLTADYRIDIVTPGDFVRANPVIRGTDGTRDISDDWYIIARCGEQYITIDLNQARLGRCYDSNWDCHAVAGSCAVIALNFESLLRQLMASRGSYWYWLENDFTSLGDAYDA